jgi:hypothetical protein
MTKLLGLAFTAAVVWSAAQANVPNDEASLDLGIRQVNEGDLSSAVLTLDAVILQLTGGAPTDASALVQAYLYRAGVAIVGGMVALGGVSIAASHSEIEPAPIPTSTPTPDASLTSTVGLPLTIGLAGESFQMVVRDFKAESGRAIGTYPCATPPRSW